MKMWAKWCELPFKMPGYLGIDRKSWSSSLWQSEVSRDNGTTTRLPQDLKDANVNWHQQSQPQPQLPNIFELPFPMPLKRKVPLAIADTNAPPAKKSTKGKTAAKETGPAAGKEYKYSDPSTVSSLTHFLVALELANLIPTVDQSRTSRSYLFHVARFRRGRIRR